MGQFLRLITAVVLNDVGAMWVRVVFWSCRLDLCLWLLSVLFDVTDETTISQFFAPRYCRFLLEEDSVSAVNSVADTLWKSSELVGEGFSPNFFFVALHEVALLLGLTGDRVSDRVCFRDCDIICRIDVL